ncbi:branched-chain alpha-keto acid dehydrogenase, E2 component, dihydrolipoamide acetyltransferase [Enterococcus phoeniculicola ATCC BAA-412]|jgi:2-oxoisovalerate dehydrogenase E2 component (dihydrolipoyl transacylase)|uniref:Dihydrolipoamide acetyltransferase component of pyruvate dehydrogenase complex n=2 Tax=Enterococcus phoeniculicola TaxID=154621 RepID=R3TNT6_9ENTE|nr:branched-chain alpha-keto acid dehydrogenase, E2 component, dihydrolipoamide acetyltransferase [Enterococcus phoeniculicola ATCC BAA-412]EOT78988.1 branched-chain alpha-keto acid dehydrogenase, E2 component, dihydrolipoamide acetyltransferase [Enterococcus phoeniculicola ATCC BAA-412]
MMAIKEILMPNLGESVTEASVVQWLVQPGDKVKRYSPLMEVVSDKVTTEVPSDFEGVVKEHLIELDTDVPIGTAVMTLEVEGDDSKTVPSVPVEASTTEVKEQPDTPVAAAPKPAGKNAGRYSPAVLKLAQEKGIDLTEVTGTGNEGRITRKDIMNFTPAAIEKPAVLEAAPKQAAPEPVAPASVKPATPAPAHIPTNGNDTVVPADGVRKAIAKKMVQSVNEIPHAWIMVEADVSNIVSLRNSVKEDFKKQEGMSLSFFPFFAKAVVQALKKNPKINTSWQDGNIIYHNDINLSIAVTTDDHLYVPVIHQADNYSLAGLTKEINRLAGDVRSGTLANADMQGGTFTLNNTGSLGSVQSMGIINHPQAAILQVESINKRVVPTKDGGFKVADMVNLCLSIDHRILDGQQAGKFLKDVKENLARFSNESDIY